MGLFLLSLSHLVHLVVIFLERERASPAAGRGEARVYHKGYVFVSTSDEI